MNDPVPSPMLPSIGPPAPAPRLPALATRLAYLGLVPFVLGALLLWIVRPDAHPYVALALSGYAATVIAFVGGVHWGLAFAELRAPVPAVAPLYRWGVVASIVAWIAVVLPAYAGLVVQGAMLIVGYLVDRRVYPQHGAAAWLTLRFRCSAIAALSCFIGAAAS